MHRVDVPPFCIFVRWHSVQAFSHDAYGGGASVQRKYSFNLLVHSQRSFYSFIDSANGSFIAYMYAAGWLLGCGAINQGGRG